MASKLRLAVLGAGRIGRLHIQNLTTRIPGVEVAVVADVYRPAAEKCAEDFSISAVSSDPMRVIDDPGIEAVVICSSTDTHADLIAAAAKAGKQIFCEKPIALGLERIDAALDAVKKAGVKLQIGFNRRFDSNHRRVHDLVRSGEIGDLHVLKITSRDPSPPPIDYVKVSGGIFLDMMIHDFDMARFITGSGLSLLDEPTGLAPRALRDIRAGQAVGCFAAVDADVALCAVAGGLLGLLRLCQDHPERMSEQAVDRLAEAILRLLGVPAAEAARLAALPLPDPGNW